MFDPVVEAALFLDGNALFVVSVLSRKHRSCFVHHTERIARYLVDVRFGGAKGEGTQNQRSTTTTWVKTVQIMKEFRFVYNSWRGLVSSQDVRAMACDSLIALRKERTWDLKSFMGPGWLCVEKRRWMALCAEWKQDQKMAEYMRHFYRGNWERWPLSTWSAKFGYLAPMRERQQEKEEREEGTDGKEEKDVQGDWNDGSLPAEAKFALSLWFDGEDVILNVSVVDASKYWGRKFEKFWLVEFCFPGLQGEAKIFVELSMINDFEEDVALSSKQYNTLMELGIIRFDNGKLLEPLHMLPLLVHVSEKRASGRSLRRPKCRRQKRCQAIHDTCQMKTRIINEK